MEDPEQLSPHSGYESVTFDKDDDLEFRDFESDFQVTSWTNLMPGTKKSQDKYKDDHDNAMGFQVESNKRKSEDCCEKSYDENVNETNKVIERKAYGDAFLQDKFVYGMWQSPWTSNNPKRSF